jgi:hypothetical protein
MKPDAKPAGGTPAPRVVVDIGSTVVKVAKVDDSGVLLEQRFVDRDFTAGVPAQVRALLAEAAGHASRSALVCSSANGGLRVGIVCLSKLFSGAVLREQVLLAGANPVFVQDFDEAQGHPERVDILLVGGGIDCADAAPLRERLAAFDPARYRHGSLMYAGNASLAAGLLERAPDAILVDNPIADSLAGRRPTVFEVVRRAYLDDLVYKEGVSELAGSVVSGIRPTPEIVNRGFLRAVRNESSLTISGGCVLFDIGGATTDVHYTIEIVPESSAVQPLRTSSVGRYVFVDLGIVASRESLMLQLRTHPRLYDFLEAVGTSDVRATYQALREGDHVPAPAILSYGCLFLALDRFAEGRGPGLPKADLSQLTHVLLTGGAAQALCEDVALRVVEVLLPRASGHVLLQIDRRYQLWVDGITWQHGAVD